MKVALYARISTGDQNSLPFQLEAMRTYCANRGWTISSQIEETGGGASEERPQREQVLNAARRRDIDAVMVWRLDRWGRDTLDLLWTLEEFQACGVAFISVTEALDLTTPMGRAMVALLSVFAQFEREVLSERVQAGVRDARARGVVWGRPATARAKADEVRRLFLEGKSKTAIARELGLGRASVIRILRDASTQPESANLR